MQALRPFTRYADFTGRSGRAEYWQFILLTAIGGTICRVLDAAVDGYYTALPGRLALLFLSITIVPQVSVAVRRLHDRGKPGTAYYVLLGTVALLIAMIFIGEQIAYDTGDATISKLAVIPLVAMLVVGVYVVVQLCRAGDATANAYGPPDVPTDQPTVAATFAKVAAAVEPRKTVLTDDALNAIERLERFSPELNQRGFTRPRFSDS